VAVNGPRQENALFPVIKGGAIFACCVLMAWLGVVVHRPYATAGRMEAENAFLKAHNRRLELENQRLAHRISQLDTDAGMEREARKLGYVKKGEQPLIIPADQ